MCRNPFSISKTFRESTSTHGLAQNPAGCWPFRPKPGMPSPIHGCACGSCDIAAASGRLTAATIRKGPSCGSSCRWCSIRARTAGTRCRCGDTKGRIAQLMMMVAFGRNAEAALDRAREARFASPSKALPRSVQKCTTRIAVKSIN